MKTPISRIIVLALLVAGCVTYRPYDGPLADADRDHCREESKGREPGIGAKVAVYASNIVVVPLTFGLTLGMGTMFMAPLTGYEAEQHYFDQCMTRLGYKPR